MDASDGPLPALTDWLRRRGVTPTSFAETHVSVLAFTDDRVWKCKKPVRFPFSDFSTLELRAANCEREVALNRRLAPDVYLGVSPVDDELGAVVDYAVEMRRLPDERRLAAIAHRGGGNECVDRLAAALVEFHEHATTGGAVDDALRSDAIAALWTSSIDELRPFVGTLVDQAVYDTIARDALNYVAGRRALFDARRRAARSRDGHGDLLADDVFCLDDGPRALDCLEFDDHLRYGDVLADVAFLAMDLERLDRSDLARLLLDRYRERSGDEWPRTLEHHYIAYRALVRAKVACLRAASDAGAAGRAHELLDLCARHLARGRVRLVLIGGPPASGKTTLAHEIGRRTGWPVRHSDEVRKRLAGLTPSTHAAAPLDRGLYSGEWTDRAYRALLDEARALLGKGEHVVLDASWSSADHRAAALDLAAETHSTWVALRCEIAPDIAEARAVTRTARGDDTSDADALVARALADRFEAWPDATVVHTDAPAGRVADQLVSSPAFAR